MIEANPEQDAKLQQILDLLDAFVATETRPVMLTGAGQIGQQVERLLMRTTDGPARRDAARAGPSRLWQRVRERRQALR